jgi:hypothetical protein
MGDIESAIADIQLLGAPSQVAMAADFARKMGEAGDASLDGLLADLRKSLRGELELEPVDNGIVFLRLTTQGIKQHPKLT